MLNVNPIELARVVRSYYAGTIDDIPDHARYCCTEPQDLIPGEPLRSLVDSDMLREALSRLSKAHVNALRYYLIDDEYLTQQAAIALAPHVPATANFESWVLSKFMRALEILPRYL